jgi:hypothetical protein
MLTRNTGGNAEDRAAKLRVAGEKAADETRLLAVTAISYERHLAASGRAHDLRERARRKLQVAAHNMGIAVGKDDDVARLKRRLGATVLGPCDARAFHRKDSR